MFLCLSTEFFLGKSFFVHSSLWSLAPVQLMGFFLYLFPPWPSVERVLGNTPCCRLYSFLLRAFSAHILFIRGRCPSRVTGPLYTASWFIWEYNSPTMCRFLLCFLLMFHMLEILWRHGFHVRCVSLHFFFCLHISLDYLRTGRQFWKCSPVFSFLLWGILIHLDIFMLEVQAMLLMWSIPIDSSLIGFKYFLNFVFCIWRLKAISYPRST